MSEPHTNVDDLWFLTDGIDPDAVELELQRVLKSRHFRHSKRASQFLRFVVLQKVLGNQELIKERLIGVELFGRRPDYATGDDPIVRVQGGEVRRRLELYQKDFDPERVLQIELPLGSYVPLFRSLSQPESSDSFADAPQAALVPRDAEILPLNLPVETPLWTRSTPANRRKKIAYLVSFLILLAVSGFGLNLWYNSTPAGQMRAFWGSALTSERPVLVCLGSPVLYLPRMQLFQRYTTTHPDTFLSAVDRHNRVLPLDPDEPLRWGDLYATTNSGPAIGGVRAGINISSLLARHSVPFSVRFGEETTFNSLRESPAVIVGAMNSRWILKMQPDLHFVMTEVDGRLWIKEAGPNGRKWTDGTLPNGRCDYGLITRQLSSPTGQFLVKLEGITDGGTQAASEIVAVPENLHAMLKNLPNDWQKKNLQMVVATDITEGKAGPPKLVAFYVW